jgi:hypothetical protein
MQAVRTSIGGTEVLIESMDNDVEVLGGPPGSGRLRRPAWRTIYAGRMHKLRQ